MSDELALVSDYQYFDVEFGDQCFCGDTIEAGSAGSDDRCNMACMGDKTRICGGSEVLSVYQKRVQTS